MFKNVAAKFRVYAFNATTGLPKTGDAANITAYVSKDYGAVTVLGDTSAAEEDATNAKGYYLFDAAQAETNADVLMVSAKSATADIVVIGAPAAIYTRPTTGWLAPSTAGRTLVVDAAGLADANTVKIGPSGTGTAQTAGDVPARIPAALVGGRIDANMSAVSNNTTALANFLAGILGLVPGTCAAGSSTTSIVTNLTEATNDHFNGAVITFTGGALIGQRKSISDYDGATKTLTVVALTEAPANTDPFVIS